MRWIVTWTCKFCGWANDNNNGPCYRCGGHTELRLFGGKWREVILKEPNPDRWRKSLDG